MEIKDYKGKTEGKQRQKDEKRERRQKTYTSE
jgi:hypothetical protein